MAGAVTARRRVETGTILELRRSHWVAFTGSVFVAIMGGGFASWWTFARNVATKDETVDIRVYQAERKSQEETILRMETEVGKVGERLGHVETKLAVTGTQLEGISRQLDNLIQAQGRQNGRNHP